MLCIAKTSFSQYNDTIIYKSGMVKIVEVNDFTTKQIDFEYVNKKGDTTTTFTKLNVVHRFVIYDSEGILQYNSDTTYAVSILNKTKSTTQLVSVSKHELSISPLPLFLLSVKAKHTYNFGEKMQFGWVSRFAYLNPYLFGLFDEDFFSIGTGFKYTPYYNNRASFGFDICPMLLITSKEVDLAIPLSLDFNYYVSERFGVSFDFGIGPRLNKISLETTYLRSQIGFLWHLKTKKTFEIGM